MYSLKGLIGRRGFKLVRGDEIVFQTRHKIGLLPASAATVEGAEFKIKYANFVGDKLNIIKDGNEVGRLDYSNYCYATLNLSRLDGGADVFRLDERGF